MIQHGALPSELPEDNSVWGSNSSGANATSLYSTYCCAGLEALRKGSAALVNIHSWHSKSTSRGFVVVVSAGYRHRLKWTEY